MSTLVFENRIIFLLCVIISILLIALWGAYTAFIKMEKSVSKMNKKVDDAIAKGEQFYQQNQSKIPKIMEDIMKLLNQTAK
ncbi:MAG TPA: hypothetical protein PKD85_00875 [Saprospiraceae bacterium]|nr:hypothetical protein [Saprospiraceae bacterium]